jgi:hemerythrin-like domain-containing protein
VQELKKYLSQDHEDHDSLEAKRPAAELRGFWVEFEQNLLDHLETEERALFSVAAQAHPLEVETLRAEHRQIRQAVFGMSVSVELHTLKKAAINDLILLLHSHTEHEKRSLHCWIEADESVLARRGVLAIRSRRERSSPRLRAAPKVGD